MINWILSKIAWDYNNRQLQSLWPLVDHINKKFEEYNTWSDDQLKNLTVELKQRYQNGETLDDLLPEAFALHKQASKRLVWSQFEVKGDTVTWNMVPYDVQLLWGIILHKWKIAEMKTGEWKTLVATLPAFLNALSGKGVHVVSVNDYLSSRDAEWMTHLFTWLWISVWVITKQTPLQKRRQEYEKDITYVENSELGFDYLRDNLTKSIQERNVLFRPLNYAIVDEADSILIDEARTPLIISQPSAEPTQKYGYYAQIVKALTPAASKKRVSKWLLHELLNETNEEEIDQSGDYFIDEKTKSVSLSSAWIAKLEQMIGVANLYKDLGYEEIHHIENALKALAVYQKDKDYLIKDSEVMIVDENTWRVMPWRRYSEWLHQAIEAKEWVTVQRESQTLASITYQNFFKQYAKVSWMTWTAATEWEEFEKIYKAEVLIIPTNRDIIRVDKNDKVFFDQHVKWASVANTIWFYHQIGVPMLIWTSSIQTSEHVSTVLRQMTIPHYVLNAKFHEQEAQIVASAGQMSSVVVATNMAGRWTDIKLEEWLNEKIADNYVKWIDSVMTNKSYDKKPVNYFKLDVYSQQEYDILTEKLHKFLATRLDKLDHQQMVTLSNGWNFEVIFNQKKKSKDEVYASLHFFVEKTTVDFVKELHFGLFVLGTEKHESRRIDNQLRWRSWRQWDPGSSQFYVALDDEIMRKIGGDQVKSVAKLLMPKEELETMELTQTQFTSSIIRAQKQMEAWNFSIRKQLFDYDSVVNKQRQKIYAQRDSILAADENFDVFAEIRSIIPDVIRKIVQTFTVRRPFDYDQIIESIKVILIEHPRLEEVRKYYKEDDMITFLEKIILQRYDEHLESIKSIENISTILRRIYLDVTDKYWIQHIDEMQYLKDKVGLYGYAQQEPLLIYKKEAFAKFEKLLFEIKQEFLAIVIRNTFVQTPAEQVIEAQDQIQQQAVVDLLKEVSENVSPQSNLGDILQKLTTSNTPTPRQSNQDWVEVIEIGSEASSSTDSIAPPKKKLRPNDLCYCGSGKKYKHCHGKE